MTAFRNESALGLHRQTIAALFRDPSDAERAISELSGAGFSKKDIGVALSDGATDSGKKSSSGWAQRLQGMFSPHERDEYHSRDPLDVLAHMGVAEEDRPYFKNALQRGGVLVSVNTGGRTQKALSILKNCKGMTSESQRGEEGQRGEFSREAKLQTPMPQTKDIGEHHIQLMGENLRVNKERIQRGAVTLKKRVVSERQNIEVPVSHEELIIERKPADGREATRAEFEDGKEIKIPLTEERVRAEKRPVVREEVIVGKRQVQETKKVGDEVRHEELDVDKEGNVPGDSIQIQKRA
jgi:uncharacterized protein (TIGR02271 family)